MNYSSQDLNQELQKLVGQEIAAAFYHTHYENYPVFTELAAQIQEIPALYLLLKTANGHFFNVTTREYYAADDLAGITVFQSDVLINPHGRPNHIHAHQWAGFNGHQIVETQIVEDFYIKKLEKYAVPLGIRLLFDGGQSLYALNMGIHAYHEKSNTYQFYRGGESVTLFFSEEAVRNHKILTQNVFVVQEI